MEEEGEGRASVKRDLSSFLAKVDEIGDLVHDLTSSDPSTSAEAIRKADRYLDRNNGTGASSRTTTGVVAQDRTVVNRTTSHSSSPSSPSVESEFPNPEAAAFCRALEEDAKERGERRRERERVGREAKKRGNEAFRRGACTTAIEHYTEAISQMPWDISLYTNRALTHNRLGNHKEAIKDCDRAIRFEPNTLRAYVQKGKALVAQKEFESAEGCYKEAHRLFPQEREAIEGYIHEMEDAAKANLQDS